MEDHLEFIEPNQKILDKLLSEFTEATGLATILVDTQGIELTPGYGFSPFCQLMRNNEDTRKLCQHCDMFGGRSSIKNKQTTPYVCHAGLVDFSYPVTIDNQLIGFILCGQTRIEVSHPFQEIINEKTDWRNDPLFVEVYEAMPLTTPEKIKAGSELLTIIINYYLADIMNTSLKANVEAATNLPDFSETESTIKKINTTKRKNSLEIVRNIECFEQRLPQIERPEIITAIKYINDHLNEVITLDEVADFVHLSGYYFSKLFKKEVGITFIDYINEKKISRAMILLQDSTWSIDSIAHSLGYSQSSYFSKLFKKTTKMSPRDYRQLIQKEKEAYRV